MQVSCVMCSNFYNIKQLPKTELQPLTYTNTTFNLLLLLYKYIKDTYLHRSKPLHNQCIDNKEYGQVIPNNYHM